MREFVKGTLPADTVVMHDDPFASLSAGVFGSHPPAADAGRPARATVDAGGIRFHGLPTIGDHGCDDEGRLPIGAGYFTGDDTLDLCSVCFEPERPRPEFAPAPEDQVRFARNGIGCDGDPRIVELTSASELTMLRTIMDEHHVRRILVRSSLPLPEDPRFHAPTRSTPGTMESGSLRSFELQLRGLAFGPPLDPDLAARLEAAKDERGVIRDPDLGNEYHEALVAQATALDELLGRPEPVIEQGPVFPSFPDDDESLPG